MKTWTKVAVVLFGLFFWAMVVNGVYDAFDEVLPASVSYEEGGGQVDAATVAVVLGGIGPLIWLVGVQDWIEEWKFKAREKQEEQWRAWQARERDRERQESDD